MRVYLLVISMVAFFLFPLSVWGMEEHFNSTDKDTLGVRVSGSFTLKSSSYIKEKNLYDRQEGLIVKGEINPFFSIPFLKNIYLGGSYYYLYGNIITNYLGAVSIGYYLPVFTKASNWIPGISVYVSGFTGIVFLSSQDKLDQAQDSKSYSYRSNNMFGYTLGVELSPKYLDKFNLSLYIEAQTIVSKLPILSYNAKYMHQRSELLSVGLTYAGGYLNN